MTTERQNRLAILNARVFTGNPRRPWADAVLIRGDRIETIRVVFFDGPCRSWRGVRDSSSKPSVRKTCPHASASTTGVGCIGKQFADRRARREAGPREFSASISPPVKMISVVFRSSAGRGVDAWLLALGEANFFKANFGECTATFYDKRCAATVSEDIHIL